MLDASKITPLDQLGPEETEDLPSIRQAAFALLYALEDMVCQHSEEYKHKPGTYFSGFLSSDAQAMRLLAKFGRMDIDDGGMRVVEGRFR